MERFFPQSKDAIARNPSILSCHDLQLLRGAAKDVAVRGYAPYSGLQVGASVLGESGQIYLGCNVESAAFPVGLCAERNAVGSAIAAGEKRLRALAVAAHDESVSTLVPCGMCLQFLSEFDRDLVVLYCENGEWRAECVSHLLPKAFRLRG